MNFLQLPPLLRALSVGAMLALVSCSADHEPETAHRLDAPTSVRVDPSWCRASGPATAALLSYQEVGGHCVRRFTGLGGGGATPRKRALATAPSRLVTADELFDWAQVAYSQFFPSARTSLQLGPYTYRYYPESGNHVALAGQDIYVQGPISGGMLLFVGTLGEFSCLVMPSLCGEPPRDCDAPSSWTVGSSVCTPNAGQPTRVASGATTTFVDLSGPTTGNAAFRCSDGTLSAVGTALCTTAAPRSCDTSALQWTIGGNTCTPDPSEPKSIASGVTRLFSDSAGTSGSASWSCNDSTLTRVGAATCNAPAPLACRPTLTQWVVNGNTCVPDQVPEQIASGMLYTFVDTFPDTRGELTFQCSNGVLTQVGANTCERDLPRIDDSFGGDGGAADGGANGDGTAADGAPIVGGLVTVVDMAGRTVQASAPTDAQGYFRVRLTGMQPPLVVSVQRPDGIIRRSFSTQPLVTNGYIFIAVTGLTDWLASSVAGLAADIPSAAALTPAMVAANPGAVTASINALRNNVFVNPELVAAGLDPNTFDPLATPFRPNGTGYDRVLDNLVITTNTSGSTVIGPTYCFTPTSWTVNGITCTPNAGTPATIPSFSTLIVTDSDGVTRGTVGFTCIKGVLQNPVLPNCK